jgi:hypothetical protein
MQFECAGGAGGGINCKRLPAAQLQKLWLHVQASTLHAFESFGPHSPLPYTINNANVHTHMHKASTEWNSQAHAPLPAPCPRACGTPLST